MLAEQTANDLVEYLAGNGSPPNINNIWVQLHDGDPGPDGTDNIAPESSRQQVTFAESGSGGSIVNSETIEWDDVDTDNGDVYTFYSAWTQESTGTFKYSGVAISTVVNDGDTIRVAPGGLILSFDYAESS